jgi:hypothetical protein
MPAGVKGGGGQTEFAIISLSDLIKGCINI